MDVKFRHEWLVFAIVFIASMMTYVGLATSLDMSQFLLMSALYQRGSFSLCELPNCDGKEGIVDMATYNGRLFSDRAIGTAIFYLPLVPIAYMTKSPPFVLNLLTATLMASSCVLIFRISKHLGAGTYPATASALCFGLATIALKYSAVLFSHALSVFLLTFALWKILTLKEDALTYLAIGYLPIVEYPNALLSAILLTHLLLKKRLRFKLLLLASIPGVILLTHNYYYFGSPFSMSYNFSEQHPWVATSAAFDGNILEGLLGLSIGNDKVDAGLLLLSPFLLFGVAGLYLLSNKDAKWLLTIMFLSHLLLYSKYRIYNGGAVNDTRYLITVLPCLVIPVSIFLQNASKTLEALFWMTVAYSLFQVATDIALFHCMLTQQLIDLHLVHLPIKNLEDASLYLKCFWSATW